MALKVQPDGVLVAGLDFLYKEAAPLQGLGPVRQQAAPDGAEVLGRPALPPLAVQVGESVQGPVVPVLSPLGLLSGGVRRLLRRPVHVGASKHV